VDGQLDRSLADMLRNVFGLVGIVPSKVPSIHYANVKWGLQDSS